MKKAIVTGACGFIGSNLVRELTQHGYHVFAVIRKGEEIYSDFATNSGVTTLFYEMQDYPSLKNEEALVGVDVVFQLAWAGVSDALSQSFEVQLNNVKASCDLLISSIALNAKRYVFAGSVMEYEHDKAIQGGYFGVSTRNIYHVAKSTARKLTQIISNDSAITYSPITISNVYGPGDRSMRLVNHLVINILKKRIVSLTSCEQLYDFIYIDDAVRAMRLVGERGSHNKNYYIGNEAPRTLKEFIKELHETVDPKVPLGIGEKEYQGISLDYDEFDMHGIYDDFNFVPETNFVRGIQKTSEWIASHMLVSAVE